MEHVQLKKREPAGVSAEPDEGLISFYGPPEVEMLKQAPNTDITGDGRCTTFSTHHTNI